MKVPGTGLPDLEGGALGKISKWAAHPRLGANGAMTKRHETVGAIAKRPLDAPRYYSGHGEGPTSSIRPPSHAWRARQDGKSGRRGASGTKRPLGRSAAPTESPLHAPRACPTLRDSLSPHAGIGGNAWGTAPSSKRRPPQRRAVPVLLTCTCKTHQPHRRGKLLACVRAARPTRSHRSGHYTRSFCCVDHG